MKHTLLNVWGFFPYLWKEENCITMETSLGFRHFPIESSLVEESFGQTRYQNDTHPSTWPKKPTKSLPNFLNQKRHLPLDFRASITKVSPPKTNIPGLPRPGFCAYALRFRKGPSPPPFGTMEILLRWLFWGELLGKTWYFTEKVHQSSWSVGLFEDLFIFCTSYDFRRFWFLVTLE